MISICVPYCPDGGRRDKLFEWCAKRWLHIFPDAEIVVGEDDSLPFNRSAARNDAYRKAKNNILVFADADTTAPDWVLKGGLDLLTNDNWVLPYEAYYNVSRTSTNTILEELPSVALDDAEITWEHRIPYPPHPPYGPPVSGILMIKKPLFEAVGGYDEQYQGWGYEDTDFALALETLFKPAVRLPGGYVFHLWHPVADGTTFDSPTIKHNKARHLLYEAAVGDPQRMASVKGRSL